MPRRHSQKYDHSGEKPAIQREPEERLRHAQQNHTLGALHHSYLGVDAERFGTRASVAHQIRADDSDEADCQHRQTVVNRIRGVEERDSAEECSVGDAVQGRIVECAENRDLPGAAGDNSIESVRDCGEPDDESARVHVSESERDSADYGGKRTYCSKRISRYAQLDKHGGNGFHESEVACRNEHDVRLPDPVPE